MNNDKKIKQLLNEAKKKNFSVLFFYKKLKNLNLDNMDVYFEFEGNFTNIIGHLLSINSKKINNNLEFKNKLNIVKILNKFPAQDINFLGYIYNKNAQIPILFQLIDNIIKDTNKFYFNKDYYNTIDNIKEIIGKPEHKDQIEDILNLTLEYFYLRKDINLYSYYLLFNIYIGLENNQKYGHKILSAINKKIIDIKQKKIIMDNKLYTNKKIMAFLDKTLPINTKNLENFNHFHYLIYTTKDKELIYQYYQYYTVLSDFILTLNKKQIPLSQWAGRYGEMTTWLETLHNNALKINGKTKNIIADFTNKHYSSLSKTLDSEILSVLEHTLINDYTKNKEFKTRQIL